MFEQPTSSTPWYRSRLGVGAAATLLLLCGLGVYLYMREDPQADAHYAALERHRAEQQKAAPPPTEAQQGAPAAEQTAATQQTSAQVPGEQQQAQATDAAAADAQGAAQTSSPPAQGARARRNNWTEFRGTRRDGRSDEQAVKTNWPAGGPPLLWKQPVGGGYSSFSVADGVAYTIEQRRGQEVVAAYHLETGRELWTHAWDAIFRESTGDGPRATPTWDAGRLYALGGTGELRALDAKTGKRLWSKNILAENGASNLQWGMAASPLVVDDKVIVMPGGSGGRTVVAYNKMTGAPAWKALSDQASYTSPMLVTLAGRRHVLVVTASSAAGLDPASGAVLWSYPWPTSMGINVSQPIVAGPNRFFISAGYGKGAALVELSGAGDKFTARAVWENTSMKNKFNSSVLHDGHVYGLDEGILTCLDLQTGQRKWKGGRYGYGQVVLTGGHLIVTTEEGEVVVVRATPEQHTEVARFKAFDERTWNVPAIADGRLLVRNAKEMACYKLTD